jgi:uncharacterized delta-60 repeat protein
MNKIKITPTQLFVVAFLLCGLMTIQTPAAPGNLDLTFGTGGKVITNLDSDEFAQKMAIQPDGKIVVSGLHLNYDGSHDKNFLVRYNPNGVLDTNFGTNGNVFIFVDGPTRERSLYGLAILPDGKILVSGSVYNPAAFKRDFAVFRFNSNGSRDASFGVNGVVSASVSGCSNDSGYTLQVQPDGKIVVIGNIVNYSGCNESAGIGAVHFHADGSLDTAFGTNGKLYFSIPLYIDKFSAPFHSALLPDGKLLLMSRTTGLSNGARTFLSRINAKGTLDASFGTNGVLLPDQSENDAFQFALQPDGKIVLPMRKFPGNVTTQTTIFRFNPDGTPDASFGTIGIVVIPVSEGVFYRSVLVQPNGKILTAKSTTENLDSSFATLRLNADGSRDASFGTNGVVTTVMGPQGDQSQAVFSSRIRRLQNRFAPCL